MGAAGVPRAQRALLAGFVFRHREVLVHELLLELSSSWHSRAGARAVLGRSPLGGGAGQRDTQPPARGPLPHFWGNRRVPLC